MSHREEEKERMREHSDSDNTFIQPVSNQITVLSGVDGH